ncbi:MAG: ABC transporter ATP-binding protein [Clostridia bacterium]|nr:ABC transporter ATP-binding protein [Clostridia bacterium]
MSETNRAPQDEGAQGKSQERIAFESLQILIRKWKDGSIKEIFEDWKWIFSYSRKYKWAIVFYTLTGLLGSTMSLVSSVASKYTLDIITGYKTDMLGLLIAIMIGSTAFSLVVNNVVGRISLRLSLHIGNDIQSDIFDKIMDADWMHLSRYDNGGLLYRFQNDIPTVSGNAISWLPQLILVFYNFIATFIVVWQFDKTMAFLAFLNAPFSFLMFAVLTKKRRRYIRRQMEMGGQMMNFRLETFSNVDTIKSFGVAPYYSDKLRGWQKKYEDFSMDYNKFTIKTSIVSSAFGTITQGVVFGYCLYRLWTGDITYGTMTLFMTQRSRLASAFSSLVHIVPQFLNSSISAHRIRELVDLPREVHVERSHELDAHIGDGFAIEMRDLTFGYRRGKRVIRHSDLIAKPGEIVALVGPSGEGKTTLIRLILGLVQPKGGEAVIRAVDGTELPLNADTRHLFAYVPQGNTILSGSIAENMRMVRQDATDEEIIEALKIACAWDFVQKMPDTINYKLGERGRGLSEGQNQRVAIARAVLRDAPVLLLDEATSALDVKTERQVLHNIIQQRPNKTCIVTTHRPSVLNMCQRVYRVMDTSITELSEQEAAEMAIDF